jgi:CRP-like cAMP-binding protein
MHNTAWPAGTFAGQLTRPDLDRVLELGRIVSYQPNEQILRAGAASGDLLVLHSGEVKVVTSGGHMLAVRGRGDLLGELAFLTKSVHRASVFAMRLHVVTATRLPGHRFAQLLERRPRMALLVGKVVVDRLCAADRYLSDTAGLNVVDRVLRLLTELGAMFPARDRGGAEIPLTQAEIAQLVHASEVTVQRALRDLVERRLVTGGGYRRVILPCLACVGHAAAKEGTKAVRRCGATRPVQPGYCH